MSPISDLWLRVAWGPFSASPEVERLSRRHGETGWGESWTLDGNGAVSFEPGESEPAPGASTLDSFLAARRQLFARVAEALARGGFTLKDAGLDELAVRAAPRPVPAAGRIPAAPPC